MKIVIEGLDNSGKSTLAKYIQARSRIDWSIQESEGPAKSEQELFDRIERYRQHNYVIFARHPAVSQPIYNLARTDPITVSASQLKAFYESQPLFIYCEAGQRGLSGHEAKAVDTPQHLQMIWEHRAKLASAYRDWAYAHAHIIYRIGDDMRLVLKMAEAARELY